MSELAIAGSNHKRQNQMFSCTEYGHQQVLPAWVMSKAEQNSALYIKCPFAGNKCSLLCYIIVEQPKELEQ